MWEGSLRRGRRKRFQERGVRRIHDMGRKELFLGLKIFMVHIWEEEVGEQERGKEGYHWTT